MWQPQWVVAGDTKVSHRGGQITKQVSAKMHIPFQNVPGSGMTHKLLKFSNTGDTLQKAHW